MEKKIERKPAEAIITFVADKDEWTKAQNKEFNKLKSKLKVDGFRVGNVPDNIAKRHINPSDVKHEALMNLINAAYREVMEQEKFNPIAQPALSITKLTDSELEAFVTVALAPVVTLGEYKGIKVAKKAVRITEKEIDEEIEKLRNQQATMEIKDGEAASGDTVIIDFKGYVNDIPFDGGEAKNYELKLGSNSFIPGFEDALIGIKAGEERTINVTFPANYVESLAGKDAKFVVKCHDVKQVVLPELNEEFIKELNYKDVNTIDELRAHVKEDLKNRKTQSNEQTRLNEILDKCVENAVVEISDSIVEDETAAQIDRVRKQVESNGLKFEDFLNVSGLTFEKYHDQIKAEALKSIKTSLVIDEICRKENIIVDSKALNDKYEEFAKTYSMKVEDIRKALEPQQNELLRQIRQELFTKFILANNND